MCRRIAQAHFALTLTTVFVLANAASTCLAAPDQPLPPRVDRYGDPLPDQAIARLGTVRLRGVRGCLAFSPNSKLLATATGTNGEVVTFWDTTTGRAVREVSGPATLTHLVFSPDGRHLACSTSADHCRVLDVASGKERYTVAGFGGTFTGDGKTLVTADEMSAEPQVHQWDAVTGQLTGQWPTQGSLQELSIAADGRTIALTARPTTTVIRICDARTGTPICSICRVFHRLRLFALSDDGKQLAVTETNRVSIWDTSTGEQLSGCRQGATSTAAFSSDGRLVAWIDCEVNRDYSYLWLMECAGAQPRAIGKTFNFREPPCFSPDGRLLAALTNGCAVRLHDAVTGKTVRPWDAHENPVLGVAFTGDGNHLVSKGVDGVLTWDARTGRQVHRTSGEEQPRGADEALLLEGRRLTVDATGRLFRVRDARTDREVFRLEGKPDAGLPTTVIAPGGRFAAIWWLKSDIHVLDLRTGKCMYRLAPKDARSEPALSAGGEVLVWFHYEEEKLGFEVQRLATGKTFRVQALSKDEMPIRWPRLPTCVSPDGRRLLLPTSEGRLRQWDLTTGKELAPLRDAPECVWNLFWSPDSRLVGTRGVAGNGDLAQSEESLHVRWWDVATGNRLPYLDLPGDPACLLFSPDGRTLATTNLEGAIRLRETLTGRDRCVLRGHLPDAIGALAFRSDGRLLASGGDDAQAFVWDLTGHMPDGIWHAKPLDAAVRQAAWDKLAGTDATAAYEALWQLVADPEGTLALLREQMIPLPQPDPRQVRAWIAALGSDDFAERERVSRELRELGDAVADELAAALKQNLPAEARRRLEALQEALQGPPAGRQLQRLRGVEVLQNLGTPEARELLRKLAEGETGKVAREARRARERP